MSDTSEERYDLPEQPPDTCPIVDDGLRALKKLGYDGPDRSTRRRIDQIEDDDARAIFYDVLDDIESDSSGKDDVEEALEGCRKQAAALREWGQSWKDLAKKNLDKVECVCTPWDGVMLWWREIGEARWHKTWVYQLSVPRRAARFRDAKLPII